MPSAPTPSAVAARQAVAGDGGGQVGRADGVRVDDQRVGRQADGGRRVDRQAGGAGERQAAGVAARGVLDDVGRQFDLADGAVTDVGRGDRTRFERQRPGGDLEVRRVVLEVETVGVVERQPPGAVDDVGGELGLADRGRRDLGRPDDAGAEGVVVVGTGEGGGGAFGVGPGDAGGGGGGHRVLVVGPCEGGRHALCGGDGSGVFQQRVSSGDQDGVSDCGVELFACHQRAYGGGDCLSLG